MKNPACPCCRTVLTWHLLELGRAGDFAICIECSSVLQIDHNNLARGQGLLRELAAAEIEKLPAEMQRALTNAQQYTSHARRLLGRGVLA